MDWRHRAACRDEDPELFFPVGNSGPALLQIAEAKTVCRRCPVVSACLAWALETGQDAGVWGGLSEDERRALKRRQARTRARAQQEKPVAAGEMVAVAGESILSDSAVRWHPLDEEGRPGCGVSMDRVLRSPASDVPAGRRCRSPRCQALWARLNGEPEPAKQSPPVLAAPPSAQGAIYRTRRRRQHIVGEDGRAVCGPIRLDVGRARPAGGVRDEARCQQTRCRREFARADAMAGAGRA